VAENSLAIFPAIHGEVKDSEPQAQRIG